MSDNSTISIQSHDFNLADEYNKLHLNNDEDGAVATFCGKVRNNNLKKQVTGLYLEHYPGMTEKQLAAIITTARERWAINRVNVIHRIGQLAVGEQIVFVGVSSKHRQDAFAACEFIMDHLKIKATFWKKELTADGENNWLAARETDQQKANTWK
ncbi:molybdopterin synthase catalytic subunit MoaE [Thalassotalea sp. 1_MG-2023]|uniref:molybdopterin synthase catalytic subunit MoaE n=1 Tax=Thalassotalea sp. 1_MG-2023 TaxID=3062680 RepID=UPI0026E2B5CF|nr:molybdopterin synthase catalytic subunit MoaE [Thalassotalea sp. 1_MG-2023]MDO6426408.1 molybdopterin synthase catalytic subunit MoaE [Thalassotalea sp. 1_MG-2023]